MPDNELNGVRVLVTRPPEQAQNLVKLIEQHGGQPVLLPMLKIEAIEPDEASLRHLTQLTGEELVIFVSANAVRNAQHYVPQKIRHELTIAAIGRGTANELARAGLQVNLVPDSSHDSEALLELPQLTHVKDRHVVIVRGKGGREKLAETLRARGAIVDYAEVYQRVAPNVKIDEHLTTDGIDVISITSGEALANLAALAKTQQQNWLFERPLVVFHARIAQQAKELGFSKPALVVNEMSDAGIVYSLVQMQKTGA
jgi:uroporphyrinogen-III synthase